MRPTHLYIVTGASRGLGRALAQQLLAPDHTLLCLSRQPAPELASQAKAAGCALTQWAVDLGEPAPVAARLQAWLAPQAGRCASVTLINNAALMPEIAPLSQLGSDTLAQALRVGLEAPLLLSAAFLAATEDWAVPKRVLQISSGLGRHPMAAQAAYCAVKAGLDHAARCLALEEARKPHGARVCALAPGVVDTDMQVQLRNAPPHAFPDRQRFIDLQAHARLSSPAEAAAQVLACLARPDFGQQPVADVRDDARAASP